VHKGLRRTPSGAARLAILLLLLLGVTRPVVADDPVSPAPTELGEAPLFSLDGIEYRPGRGLRIGETGVVLGGFTDLKVEKTVDQGAELALDRFNLFFIFDRYPRFRAVAELQFRDIFVADDDHVGTQDFAFDVRRLFGDFTIADELTVRAGTFLTPVGYWNLILAPPLTWTTEAPLIVEETFFQSTTTGAMAFGSTGVAGGQFGYSLFSQFLHPLEDDPDLDPPDYTAGLRLGYDRGPAWSVAAAYQAAENDDEWTHLGAFNALWEHRRGQILSELYVQGGEGLSSTQWGTYIQGVLEVYDPFFLVGRYEHFDPPTPDPSLNLFTIGGVVRPLPFMAVKVEYRFVDGEPTEEGIEGFFASFTTFF
jgi:hypothetical protein